MLSLIDVISLTVKMFFLLLIVYYFILLPLLFMAVVDL